MFEECADNIEAFVVGYVSGGFEMTGFSIDILRMPSQSIISLIEKGGEKTYMSEPCR